ncbi:MAG: folate family ECF transporter S component [Clostridia bacterium]|nr:folate family ECF transporter S component [Clostridia bacterium]
MKKHFNVHTLVFSAVLVALNIVITRLLSVDVGAVRIGLGFIPIALGSMLYGAVPGATIAVIADILGAILQGKGYWIGFGLSAALMGLTYGWFLYGKEKTFRRISLCVILQAIFIDALLGALWYRIFGGTPFLAALGMRAVDAAVMIPVKILLIRYLWVYVGARIAKKQL